MTTNDVKNAELVTQEGKVSLAKLNKKGKYSIMRTFKDEEVLGMACIYVKHYCDATGEKEIRIPLKEGGEIVLGIRK